MSNRFNIKNLLYILGILILILLITILVKIPKEKSTLKEKIVVVDTTDVYRIIIAPKIETGKPFEFLKENNNWSVRQDKIISKPRNGAIGNILSEITSIKPLGLVAVDKSLWKEYELTDSLATKVTLLNKKDKKLADLMIGKFTYKQVNSPYGGNNIEGTSFVRLAGDKKIYSVEGFLAFTFGGNFNDWRNKSFIRCKKEDITKLTFTYPSDSSFILTKKDSLWITGMNRSDSTNISNYLNTVSYLDGEDFADNYKPQSSPVCQLLLEGNNLLNISVKCFREEGKDDLIFNSSLNPEVYFKGKKDGMFSKIFKPVGYFTTNSHN